MKLFLKAFTILLLLILVSEGLSSDRETPWLLSWPFLNNAQEPHSIQSGYGDWCMPIEGAHPGLDFGAALADSVLLPTDATRYTLATFSSPNAYVMFFGTDSTSLEGWGFGHLDIDDPGVYPCSTKSIVMNHQPLAPCSLYGSAPLHFHLQWTDSLYNPTPPGTYNPFDFFADNLSNYDEVQFNHVWYEERLFPARRRGIWFTPDEFEGYNDLPTAPGNPTQVVFQDIISGAVDIAVAPFSAFQGITGSDSAGVYSVSYEILRQDPISLQYVSAALSAGNFGQRFLMEMRDELPAGDSPGYRAIFLDGQRPDGTGNLDWEWNKNAYIVTNSGALDPANWTTGWDNVWTTASVNDWVTGICKGAWDTFLAIQNIWPNPPTQNTEAFFPDGRYAVKVTAVSHASRDTGIDTLPVDDLSLPNPSTEGVIVDNFQPHIIRVAAYAWNPAAGTCNKKYAGYWADSALARVIPGESEYLERLRADLHELQSEDRSGSLPSFCMIDVTESSSQSFVNHIGFSESVRTSEEHSDILSTLEPGCCIDEDIGQDPVDFLLNEIDRMENQQILSSIDATRVFDKRIYGYLLNPGQSLVLQVFYSEPTMIAALDGQDIADKLYFIGIIGSDTTWFSPEHGQFSRLPGSFQLPLASDNTTRSDLESDTTLFDSSYVVHYIFKGAYPQKYIGNIKLCFGDANLLDDEGPRDLAGNTMDSFPGTVAEPRINYGPFLNNGFETGQDTSYSCWDSPDWYHDTSTDIVYGRVGIEQDLVAEVDLNSIGLADGHFLGDCDYWCGFWIIKQQEGVSGFDVYIVKPDGSYIQHHFSTPFPIGYNFSLNAEYTISDGRYCWVTGHFLRHSGTDRAWKGHSGSIAYRVDAVEGNTFRKTVCKGDAWYPGGQFAYVSRASLIKMYPTGEALYQYVRFNAGDPVPAASGIVALPTPPNSTISNEGRLIADQTENDSNPEEDVRITIQGN
ncbi:MAG: hypothetical protein GQ565_03775, partial [Candidatus Aegiribacteria sp.]|nr:hypothetical protein [Candidatus Aegiribacteria sp.]